MRPIAIVALLAIIGLAPQRLCAQPRSSQPKPSIVGNYSGSLGPLLLNLHITANSEGRLSGTMDSPDQGAMGISCTNFRLAGKALSFSVPSVHGTWKGTVGNGGATLAGTWNQGSPMPLTFTRDTFKPAAKPSSIDGFWLGTLHAGSESLRTQVTMKSDASGHEFCTLDSLDQDAFGLPCANVVFKGNDVSFDIPKVHGHWSGKLSADGKTLAGTWIQGGSHPLTFEREAKAQTPPPLQPVTYDPAIAPVDAAGLQAVLNRDLAKALKTGFLAPATDAGVSIGIEEDGVRRVFTYGTAKPNSIFEIGSITKTFTGLVLAQMIEQGKVTLEEPVRELLPAGTVAKPAGSEITLLSLITHHSGLPRMPDNFHPANWNNPYADYDAADLYAFIAKHGVAMPADAPFLYSNVGVGLLGQALADRAGMSYASLVQDEVTGPLHLKDTVISLSREQQARFIQGHNAQHHPVHAWDLGALAGAGALRSTASDMLTYLQANLHPEKLSSKGHPANSPAATLPAALFLSHKLRADVMPGKRIAFAWMYDTATGDYWHNGGTGGYSSFAAFNPKRDYAIVVLLNTAIGNRSDFANLLGKHINERLMGKPAISLGN